MTEMAQRGRYPGNAAGPRADSGTPLPNDLPDCVLGNSGGHRVNVGESRIQGGVEGHAGRKARAAAWENTPRERHQGWGYGGGIEQPGAGNCSDSMSCGHPSPSLPNPRSRGLRRQGSRQRG